MRAVAVVALLTLVSTAAFAGDKPDVQIWFKLTEPDYLMEFNDAEVQWIEQKVSKILVERLGPEFRFLDFTTVAGSEHVLSFELRRAGPTHEVGFHINLEGPRAVDEPIYSVFRDARAAAVAITQKEPFAREIEIKLGSVDHDSIGKRLLRQIPIPAEGTKLIKDPWLGWEIPFTLSELCMDRGSVLLVENTMPVGGFSVEEAFEATSALVSTSGETRAAPLSGPIYTRVKPGQELLDELRSADPAQVVIRVIYIIDYQVFDERQACEQLIRPDEVEFGGDS